MPEFKTLGKADEIPAGQAKSFQCGDLAIAVFHVGEHFYALEDRCTHADARLSEGWVEDACVSCPWHGAQFDLETGAALSLPAVLPVRTFPVQIEGDELKVLVEDTGAMED